jgi:hypothetical protein
MVWDASTPKQVVAKGTDAEIMKQWQAGKDCGAAINAQNYDYNAFDSFGGHNSDAAFSTVGMCMNVQEVDLGGWAPGHGDIILGPETIAFIQKQNGVRVAEPPYTYNPESMPATPLDSLSAHIVGVHEAALAII